MYRLRSRGQRHLHGCGLKERASRVVRAKRCSHRTAQQGAQRPWYTGPMFRYELPQAASPVSASSTGSVSKLLGFADPPQGALASDRVAGNLLTAWESESGPWETLPRRWPGKDRSHTTLWRADGMARSPPEPVRPEPAADSTTRCGILDSKKNPVRETPGLLARPATPARRIVSSAQAASSALTSDGAS